MTYRVTKLVRSGAALVAVALFVFGVGRYAAMVQMQPDSAVDVLAPEVRGEEVVVQTQESVVVNPQGVFSGLSGTVARNPFVPLVEDLAVNFAPAEIADAMFAHSGSVEITDDGALRCEEDEHILQYDRGKKRWRCTDVATATFGTFDKTVRVTDDGTVACENNGEQLYYNTSNDKWHCGAVGSGITVTLSSLDDVAALTPSTDDILAYNGSTWTTIASGSLTTVEADTLASVVARGATTSASVAFGGLTVDTNTLYVDSTNNRVGIGTISPTAALDVSGSLLATSATAMLYDKGGEMCNVKAYGAVGDDSTDDYAAIMAAIADCTGAGVVYFPPGEYRISQAIVLDEPVTLRGSFAPRWSYSVEPRSSIKARTPFTGDALIHVRDRTISGQTDHNNGGRIENITIDGNSYGSDIDGLYFEGLVRDWRIEHVDIRQTTGDGMHTDIGSGEGYPRGFTVEHLAIYSPDGHGMRSTALNDSYLNDVLVVGGAQRGFYLTSLGETKFVGSRAVFNALEGLYIDGSTTNGGLQFTDFSTDRNDRHGILVKATGRTGITFNGLLTRRDGKNDWGGTDAPYAGVAIIGEAGAKVAPVFITDLVQMPGIEDGDGGEVAPSTGVRVEYSEYAAIDGMIWGETTALLDGGNNDNLIVKEDALVKTGYDGTEVASLYDDTTRWYTTDGGDLVYGAGGNVGIGTTSPSAKLDVAGSSSSGNSLLLRSGDIGTDTDSTQIRFGYNNSAEYQHSIRTRHSGGAQSGNAIDFWLWNQAADTSTTLGSLRAMTLEGTGNVGIGTATPTNRLEVYGGNIRVSNNVDTQLLLGGRVETEPTDTGYVVTTGGGGAGEFGGFGHLVLASRASDNYVTSIRTGASRTTNFIVNGKGNVGVGPWSYLHDFGSGVGGILGIANATTAPTTTFSGGAALYASAGELYAYDAAGNATQISPHNPDGDWWYNSTNTASGKTLQIEMESLTKKIDQILGGGYVTENGTQYFTGTNLIDDLSISFTTTQTTLESLADDVADLTDSYTTLAGELSTQTDTLTELQASLAAVEATNTLILNFFEALNPDTLVYTDLDGNLELYGILTVDKVVAEEVETKKLTIADDVDAPTAGTATIAEGEMSVVVETTAADEDAQILVTVRGLPIAVAATEVVDGESFEIVIADAVDDDVRVDWWIVQTQHEARSAGGDEEEVVEETSEDDMEEAPAETPAEEEVTDDAAVADTSTEETPEDSPTEAGDETLPDPETE